MLFLVFKHTIVEVLVLNAIKGLGNLKGNIIKSNVFIVQLIEFTFSAVM